MYVIRKATATSIAIALSLTACPTAIGQNAPTPAPDAVMKSAPVQYFLQFVRAARSANSMDSIMPYLTSLEQDKMKRTQSTFDPKVAAETRARLKSQDPKLTDDQLDHITGSPGANKLKFYKKIANKFSRVISARMKNSEVCIIKVATDNRGNPKASQTAPFSTAEVAMLQEGSYWKFKEYVDNGLDYATPQ